ncbi:MAG: CaiB/BaiF CoA transferase family protein, partial [Chloroflexota bacterium]
ADMGAEVIKVEAPGTGDFTRNYAPFFGKDVSHYFASINRNKKSIVVNLKTEAGKEVIRELAAKCDVVTENFLPGTMAKFGLAYEDLQPVNPRLIYASCSGFGQTGPYVNRPAYDVIIQAMAGTMSITGEPGRGPVRVGTSIGDVGAAIFTVVGILAALLEREKSGLGQRLDISMYDCQVALLENAFTRFFSSGEVPTRLGSRHSVITPFQAFPTKDGSFVAGAGNEKQWPAFCRALGLSQMIEDDRFATNNQRTKNVIEMEAQISDVTKTMTTEECLAALAKADVPVAPVQTIDQVVEDPQLAARNMFVEVEHPRAGMLKMVGSPIKLSRSDGTEPCPCPDLGQHTEEVLRELLGLADDQIEALRREQAI